MAKHTPPNWFVDPEDPTTVYGGPMGGKLIALIGGVTHPDEEETPKEVEERLANAHLISAAPEILIACERAESFLREVYRRTGDLHKIHCGNVLETIRNAVAKAKGITAAGL